MKDISRLKVVRAWKCGNPDDDRAGWCVEFKYDKAGVERLKRAIPAAARKWDATAKVWWIAEGAIQQLADVAPGVLQYTAQERLL